MRHEISQRVRRMAQKLTQKNGHGHTGGGPEVDILSSIIEQLY